jgi:hypothetical protein
MWIDRFLRHKKNLAGSQIHDKVFGEKGVLRSREGAGEFGTLAAVSRTL